ncbi:citryl-CoA lyase [Candidatus Riflebacteria bacterium]
MTEWNSNVTRIQPNEIRVRGYRVDELMGNVSFPRVVYLILKGELPETNVGEMMDMLFVSSIDHGTTPPSTLAARTSASTGAPLNAALSAGILSINKHHGGAIESAMEILYSWKEHGETPQQAGKKIVANARGKKIRLPGLGHRYHTKDPRTVKLLQAAEELGLAGDYVKLIKILETEMADALGKKLPINVDGAMAAILCELGFPAYLANFFFMLARLPGLAAHILEERTRMKPMRKINPLAAGYDGPQERSL